MTHDEFVACFGGVYEHSPWIAERAFAAGIGEEHDTAQGLQVALGAQVEAANREAKLTLLRAHPDLAGKLAVRGELTAASASEQAGAELDRCTPEEFDRLQELNEHYKTKFGFPFIMAVKGKRRSEIITAFERRIQNSPEAEFDTALAEVHRIALFRLMDID
jgi:OHCU decarboxylase